MITKITEKMIEHEKSCPQRINHFLKVHSLAKLIAKNENISEKLKEIIEIASIVHDIGIKTSLEKYNSSAGHYQEKEGPPIAQKILTGLGLETDYIERICHLIANHHSYDKIDGIDFQILVEADFLVNIFEDNLNTETVLKIKNNYFKTNFGKKLLNTMYIEEQGEKL